MRILHLSSEKTWRGGEQQIAYLLNELSTLGIENYVAAKKDSIFESYCIKNNIRVFSLPFKNALDVKTALAIKQISDQHQIDLIHMHSSKSHGIAVLSAIFGNKTPLILSRRVDFVPKNSWFTRWKYNHSAIKKILCVSEKINMIMRAYLKEPEKSTTVHSGVDLEKFSTALKTTILRSEYNIDSDTVLIGNTSALEDHKDYKTFINTIEILSKQNLPVHAFIIGKGSLEESLKAMVFEKKLSTKITFTGFRNDITTILPELDIFFMPSKEEGLGTSILDAFLANVPVVATHAGGIPEMVIHEQTGLLGAVGDANGLAIQIEKLINNKAQSIYLVKTAHAKVKEFSKEVTAQKTLQIYKHVLSHSS
jgi:L-malate glycosyltransferase